MGRAAVLVLTLAGLTPALHAAPPPPPREVVRAEEIRPDPPLGWDLFEAEDGRFSILLPTHRVTSEAADAGVVVHVVQARTDDGCQYAVLWSDDNGPDAAASLPALLASIAQGRGVSSDHGDLVAGQDRRAGLPGQRLRGSSEKADMDLRAYADGPRVYQLYAICPRKTVRDTRGGTHSVFAFVEPERLAFFGSFEVRR
jgi:hypothetical protein